MSIIALLAPALFDVIGMTRPPVVCAFPGADAAGLPQEVRIVDPELDMTTNGQFKVAVQLGDEALHGRVVAYDKTEARDVVVRARGEDEAVYLIALRDDGTALMRYRPTEDAAEVVTSEGSCTGFEALLERWLHS